MDGQNARFHPHDHIARKPPDAPLVHIAIKRSVACALHSPNKFQCCFPGQLLFRDDAATNLVVQLDEIEGIQKKLSS